MDTHSRRTAGLCGVGLSPLEYLIHSTPIHAVPSASLSLMHVGMRSARPRSWSRMWYHVRMGHIRAESMVPRAPASVPTASLANVTAVDHEGLSAALISPSVVLCESRAMHTTVRASSWLLQVASARQCRVRHSPSRANAYSMRGCPTRTQRECESCACIQAPSVCPLCAHEFPHSLSTLYVRLKKRF